MFLTDFSIKKLHLQNKKNSQLPDNVKKFRLFCRQFIKNDLLHIFKLFTII